jgi:hypothetical protein
MPSDTTRASVLATLPQLGLDGLPAPVSNAVAAYTAALALRPLDPPPAARAVIDAVAVKAFAAAAAKGSDVIEIDSEPVARARATEAGHADHAAILTAIRDRAPLALCTIVDQYRAQVIAALKARHAQIIGQLVPAARRLPPGITETAALDAGGKIRVDYIATRDLAAQAEQLRRLLVDVEDTPARGQVPDLAERCLTHIRDLRIYDRSVNGTAYGEPGTPEFYRALGAQTEPGDWWLPTVAERRALADELAEQRRLAGLNALPAGATVW